jgi:hypothetical protein
MLNLANSNITRVVERKIAPGTNLLAEGKAVVAVYDAGTLTVGLSTGAAGEQFAGVAISCISELKTMSAFESVVIDSSGVAYLKSEPMPGTMRIAGLTQGDPSSADKYQVVGKRLTFNSALANSSVEVSYTYSPTVAEAQFIQGHVQPGIHPAVVYGSTGVVESGDIMTSEYDTACDWSPGLPVKLGADGKFTTSGNGAVVRCLVSKLPVAGSPFLGMSFTV